MPQAPNDLAKARLTEITWDTNGVVEDVDGGFEFDVQFNPESLKLTYSSTKAGGDQSGGSALQYVGQGTTKLSMDLIFDASRDERAAEDGALPDVRQLTLKIIDFITPKEAPDDRDKKIAPGLRINWGTFLFEGVVNSVNETLDFWSEDGRPLQAKVSLNLTKQEINVERPESVAGSSPGTRPMSPANEGDSVADLAASNGVNPSNWQGIAAANGVEDARSLSAGALLNLNASASVGIGASASVGFGATAGVSAGFGVSASAGVSAGISGSVGASASSSVGLSAALVSRTPTAKYSFDLET